MASRVPMDDPVVLKRLAELEEWTGVRWHVIRVEGYYGPTLQVHFRPDHIYDQEKFDRALVRETPWLPRVIAGNIEASRTPGPCRGSSTERASLRDNRQSADNPVETPLH